jgi:hypothetical protein
MSRFPHFVHNRLTDGGEVVSLRAGSALPHRKIPGTHFCQRLSQPQGRGSGSDIHGEHLSIHGYYFVVFSVSLLAVHIFHLVLSDSDITRFSNILGLCLAMGTSNCSTPSCSSRHSQSSASNTDACYKSRTLLSSEDPTKLSGLMEKQLNSQMNLCEPNGSCSSLRCIR